MTLEFTPGFILATMTTVATLKIGELARQANVSVDTIRFYESKGLISATMRSASGYRLFSDEDRTRLLFIQRSLKTLYTACGGGAQSAQHCSILQLLESDNPL